MTELNIGALTGSKSYTGSVGTTNIDNLYKFNINSPGSFQFSLNDLSGNADIFLLNKAGAIIKTSSNSDKTAETISAEGLSAGEYTIRVLQISGDIKYTLNLGMKNKYLNELLRLRYGSIIPFWQIFVKNNFHSIFEIISHLSTSFINLIKE